MRKFFIIGCPRSGTTLLQQILVRHPSIVVPPETAFFTKLLSGWPGRFRRQREQIRADLGISLAAAGRPRDRPAQAALYDKMAADYAHRIERPDALWFGDKTPDHLRHARTISRVFPEARFILVVRDGRDVALSLSKVPWTPSDPVVNFGLWLDAAVLQEELVRDPPASIVQVRYEDLVGSPQTEVLRITEHLELDYRTELLEAGSGPTGIPQWEREWKGSAHEPIRQDRVGVWKRELDRRQVVLMERWGGTALTRLGYEISTPPDQRALLPAGAVTHFRRALWRARVATGLLLGRR